VQKQELSEQNVADFMRCLANWSHYAEKTARGKPHILYTACLAALHVHLRDLRSSLDHMPVDEHFKAEPSARTQTPDELRLAQRAGGRV
jgi:hypothetical protein